MPPAGIMNLKVFAVGPATTFHRAKNVHVAPGVMYCMIVGEHAPLLVESGVNVCQRIMVIH